MGVGNRYKLENIKINIKVTGCLNTDWVHIGQETVTGSSEQGNEPSGSTEDRELLKKLSNYYLL